MRKTTAVAPPAFSSSTGSLGMVPITTPSVSLSQPVTSTTMLMMGVQTLGQPFGKFMMPAAAGRPIHAPTPLADDPEPATANAGNCGSADSASNLVRDNEPLVMEVQKYAKAEGATDIAEIRKEAACAVHNAIFFAHQSLFKFSTNRNVEDKDGNNFRFNGEKPVTTFQNNCFRNVKIASSLCGNYIGNQQKHVDWAFKARDGGTLLEHCGFKEIKNFNPFLANHDELEGMVAIHTNMGGSNGHAELLHYNPVSKAIEGVSDALREYHPTTGVTYWRKFSTKVDKECGGSANMKT